MKIITLTDNNICSDNFDSEHGLSLYIETAQHKILFDTGQTNIFINNAEKLGLDLKEIDTVVISHGHYDHLGGLEYFLQLNNRAKVYLKPEIFDFQYLSVKNDIKKEIGYPLALKNHTNRFVFLKNEMIVFDDLILIGKIENKYPKPKGNSLLYKTKNQHTQHDDFNHELIFALNTRKGLCVFSGCAHSGILNILYTIKEAFPNKKIEMIYGGLHLIDETTSIKTETEQELQDIAYELARLTEKANLYTGHCTGKKAEKEFRKIFDSRFHLFSVGCKIEI